MFLLGQGRWLQPRFSLSEAQDPADMEHPPCLSPRVPSNILPSNSPSTSSSSLPPSTALILGTPRSCPAVLQVFRLAHRRSSLRPLHSILLCQAPERVERRPARARGQVFFRLKTFLARASWSASASCAHGGRCEVGWRRSRVIGNLIYW